MKLEREDLQRLFDLVVGSMDFGSGFLETDDVELLRKVAVHLGVDPVKATPSEFNGQYPHVREIHPRLAEMHPEVAATWRDSCTRCYLSTKAVHMDPDEYAEYLRKLAEET